ncbi:hypothetical protein LTR95_007701 [Oleoguttula sp. CCFEE 5521]
MPITTFISEQDRHKVQQYVCTPTSQPQALLTPSPFRFTWSYDPTVQHYEHPRTPKKTTKEAPLRNPDNTALEGSFRTPNNTAPVAMGKEVARPVKAPKPVIVSVQVIYKPSGPVNVRF